jgi:hypothetical protein
MVLVPIATTIAIRLTGVEMDARFLGPKLQVLAAGTWPVAASVA